MNELANYIDYLYDNFRPTTYDSSYNKNLVYQSFENIMQKALSVVGATVDYENVDYFRERNVRFVLQQLFLQGYVIDRLRDDVVRKNSRGIHRPLISKGSQILCEVISCGEIADGKSSNIAEFKPQKENFAIVFFHPYNSSREVAFSFNERYGVSVVLLPKRIEFHENYALFSLSNRGYHAVPYYEDSNESLQQSGIKIYNEDGEEPGFMKITFNIKEPLSSTLSAL